MTLKELKTIFESYCRKESGSAEKKLFGMEYENFVMVPEKNYIEKNFSNPKYILENCLEAMGYIEITDNTKKIITEHIEKNKFNSEEEKVLDILKLIVSTPDFQYC